MKVLCVCSAGIVRSAAMAHILKRDYGIDAMAIGYDANSEETMKMMAEWADVIIPMYGWYEKLLKERYGHKIALADVGPDVWGNPLHPDLLEKVKLLARDLYERGILKEG